MTGTFHDILFGVYPYICLSVFAIAASTVGVTSASFVMSLGGLLI